MRRFVTRWLVLLSAGALAFVGSINAADSPLQLKWTQLVPPKAPGADGPKLKPFFSGMPSASGGGAASTHLPEGEFMSMRSQQPGAGQPASVVAELNGKEVEIGGYVVPLDFDAFRITEFLLVPFVGACIHVPPPPANQIIYVTAAEGFEITGPFDPVKVSGTMTTEAAITGLADAGYRISANRIEIMQP